MWGASSTLEYHRKSVGHYTNLVQFAAYRIEGGHQTEALCAAANLWQNTVRVPGTSKSPRESRSILRRRASSDGHASDTFSLPDSEYGGAL